jgi:LPS export ABC transporter protein LptC
MIPDKYIFILALLIAIFAGCENDIEKIKLVTAQKVLPVESATGLEIIYSDSAKIKAKIITPELDRYTGSKNYIELPKGVKLEFYDDEHHITSTMTADYAIRNEQEMLVEAKKNVVVVNEKNEKLNTEHLIWNEKTKKIYSDEFVKITTADEIIFGTGFEADQDFSKYRIMNIKGTINIKKSDYAPLP